MDGDAEEERRGSADSETIQAASASLRSKSKSSLVIVSGISTYVSEDSRMRLKVLQVLGSQKFDSLIGIIIVVNSATIGLEMSLRLEGSSTDFLEDLEHFFLATYFCELMMRFYAIRWNCFTDLAVLSDCLLVASGILITWIMRPLNLTDSTQAIDGSVMVVLRMLRLMRLARTVRLLVKFRELWLLVRGLINSASTILYTCILLLIVLYVLACVGLEMVSMNALATGNADVEPIEDFENIVSENFSSLGVTMMTLVQFVCLDSIASIYKPLILLDWVLLFYFMSAILVIGIVLMNLVTAVVVNSALEQASQDKEAMRAHEKQQKKKLLKQLRSMFARLDEDESGHVSREEIAGITDVDRQLLGNILSNDSDPMEIFDALDIEGDGHLSINEFCDGIWSIATSKSPLDIKRIEKQVKQLHDQLKDSANIQASIWQAVKNMHNFFEQQGMTPQQLQGSERSVTSTTDDRAHFSTMQASFADVPAFTGPSHSAWVEDLTLRLQQSLLKAVKEAVGAAKAVDSQGIGPPPDTKRLIPEINHGCVDVAHNDVIPEVFDSVDEFKVWKMAAAVTDSRAGPRKLLVRLASKDAAFSADLSQDSQRARSCEDKPDADAVPALMG